MMRYREKKSECARERKIEIQSLLQVIIGYSLKLPST